MGFLLTDASHMICHRAQSKCWTLLPIGWRLLLEAKKISRHLSLVLTVAGMVMLSLIALWKPWIHFRVPLGPPGDPAGPQTISIDTIFFMLCPDISCMNEYDKMHVRLAPSSSLQRPKSPPCPRERQEQFSPEVTLIPTQCLHDQEPDVTNQKVYLTCQI